MMTNTRKVSAVVLSSVVWIIVLIFCYLLYEENVNQGIPPIRDMRVLRQHLTGGTKAVTPSPTEGIPWTQGIIQRQHIAGVATAMTPSPTEAGPKSLFIVAYHRTGSTFTASIFDAYPGSFYIFEPLFGMNVGQTIRFFNDTSVTVTEENTSLLRRDMYTKLLRCDLQSINTALFYKDEWFVYHKSFRLFKQCLFSELSKLKSEIQTSNGTFFTGKDANYVKQMIESKGKSGPQRFFQESTLEQNKITFKAGKRIRHLEKKCVVPVQKACEKSDIRVFKFIRVLMEEMEPLMLEFPGLKIIHLIRDPRGNALSQAAALKKWNKIRHIAENFCRQVATDIRAANKIEISIPNRLATLEYENLTENPFEETQRMYDFIDLPLVPEIEKHLNQVAKGVKGKTSKDCEIVGPARFCVNNANAKSIANQWKKNITKEQLDDIQTVCRDTMEMMWLKPATVSQLRKQVTGNTTLNNKLNSTV